LKSIEILEQEKASIQDLPPQNDELIKQQIADGMQLFEKKDYATSIPEFKGLPKWIQSFFKFGKLPVYLF